MALDPQIQLFLEQMATIESPPIPQQPVEEVRQGYELIGMFTPVPEGVTTDDVTVPGPAGDLAARVYRGDVGVAPGVVYFHGGGHVIGSLATHDGACGLLARDAGCTVVSVEYRLAPEHPFPADVDDAEAAARWVAGHADDLGIDRDRLAVAGDSAGGNLAAVVARRGRDLGLVGQLLLYPWVDLACTRPSMTENALGRLLQLDALDHWRSLYVAGDEALHRHPDASAIYADDLAGLAPAVVVTAAGDPLCDQGQAYAERLAAAGVPARLLHYDDLIHAFIQLTPLSDRARAATEEVAGELRKLLYA